MYHVCFDQRDQRATFMKANVSVAPPCATRRQQLRTISPLNLPHKRVSERFQSKSKHAKHNQTLQEDVNKHHRSSGPAGHGGACVALVYGDLWPSRWRTNPKQTNRIKGHKEVLKSSALPPRFQNTQPLIFKKGSDSCRRAAVYFVFYC